MSNKKMQALTLNTSQLRSGSAKHAKTKDGKMRLVKEFPSYLGSPRSRLQKSDKEKTNGFSQDLNESDIEMSKIELLKLLSVFEGEVEARDEVIAILRDGLANAPVKALQRDSEAMYEVPTQGYHTYMEEKYQMMTVIQHHKDTYERLKQLHLALEEKYKMLLESIENERGKHREFKKKSDSLISVLDKDREELKQLLREKSIHDGSEDEWSINLKDINTKPFGKKMKKLKRFDRKRNGHALRKWKSEDQEAKHDILLREVEDLRKIEAALKQAEKDQVKVEKKCLNLQDSLENELQQTKALREEVKELKEKTRSKSETEKYVDETLIKFNEMEEKYEEECKKQTKMDQQIKMFSKQLEGINELEVLLKSSECKMMQLQTMVREAKREKKELNEKLSHMENKTAEYEKLWQGEKLKVEEATQQIANEKKKSLQLTEEITLKESKYTQDINNLNSKFNAAELAKRQTITKEKAAEMETYITNLRNEVITLKKKLEKSNENATFLNANDTTRISKAPTQSKQLITNGADNVTTEKNPKDINQNYLTLEKTNTNLKQEMKKVESKIHNSHQQLSKKDVTCNSSTAKKPEPSPTVHHTQHTNPVDKTNATAPPDVRSAPARRLLQKRSVSYTDMKPTNRTNPLQLTRASSKPVNLRQEKVPSAANLRQFNGKTCISNSSAYKQNAHVSSAHSTHSERATPHAPEKHFGNSSKQLKHAQSSFHVRPKHNFDGTSSNSSQAPNKQSSEDSKVNRLKESTSTRSKQPRPVAKKNSFNKKTPALESKTGRSYSADSKPQTVTSKPPMHKSRASSDTANSKIGKPRGNIPAPHMNPQSRLLRNSSSGATH